MTREELLQLLQDIGTCEDAAERRAKLTQVTEAVTGVYDSNDTLTAANTKFEADNKKLQEYNMQLFLKVGSQGKTDPVDKTGEEKTENLKYEDLFDEKGEIK